MMTHAMFKFELPGEDVGLHNLDEGVDSDILNKYLNNDLHLPILTGSQIELSDAIIMDVNTKPLIIENPLNNYLPVSPRGPPTRHNTEGMFKFKVEIDSTHTKKKKYLYSHLLNRIYVDMNVNFSVGFNWDTNMFPVDAYIRATVVFSDFEQAEKRVERCHQHSHESSNSTGLSRAILMNVLHSAREFGSPDVHYCGIPEQTDSWYSVLVRTPQPTELAYMFLCKSSCSSGINRRQIDIIFTLEDQTGEIYGRQTVGARVCSCPRRDISRDEKDEGVPGGKRSVSAVPQETKTKKVKLEAVERDDSVVKLPAIEVVGHRTAIIGLEVMLSMMEQKKEGIHTNKLNTDSLSHNIDSCIATLKKQINSLKGQK